MAAKESEIRPSVVATPEVKTESSGSEESSEIRPTVEVSGADWVEEQTQVEAELSPEPLPKTHPWLKRFFLFVVALSAVEVGFFARDVWLQQDWLGGAWLVVATLALVGVSSIVFREWRGLKRLKQQNQSQQQSLAIYQSPGIGAAAEQCELIASKLPESLDQPVSRWRESMSDALNDKEQIVLFEHQVLHHADQRAYHCISRHAGASAAMIAVSPFALLDMGIVMWRNIRMLNEITECYGIKLGYWSRIALIRQVINNMLIAGATEILSDGANYALSTGMTGKLSTKVAQGLSAGIFTARIGLKAVRQSRPMPFLDAKPPSMNTIASQLVKQLEKAD